MQVWLQRVGVAFAITVVAVIIASVAVGRDWTAEASRPIAADVAAVHAGASDAAAWRAWLHAPGADGAALRHVIRPASGDSGARWAWADDDGEIGSVALLSDKSDSDGSRRLTFIEHVDRGAGSAQGELVLRQDGATTVATLRLRGTLPPIVGAFHRKTVARMQQERVELALAALATQVEAGKR